MMMHDEACQMLTQTHSHLNICSLLPSACIPQLLLQSLQLMGMLFFLFRKELRGQHDRQYCSSGLTADKSNRILCQSMHFDKQRYFLVEVQALQQDTWSHLLVNSLQVHAR